MSLHRRSIVLATALRSTFFHPHSLKNMHTSIHRPALSRLTAWLSGALLAGCANMSATEQGTAQGAAIGAVAGVIISAATGGDAATGAVLGGAAGALGGNI